MIIEATKTLRGRNLYVYSFEFLLIRDGRVIERTFSDKDGNIRFNPTFFELGDVGKTFTYELLELPGNARNIIYDDTVYTFNVTLEDNGDGTLNVISTLDSDIVFNNEYRAELPITGYIPLSLFLMSALAFAGYSLGLFKRKDNLKELS